MAIVEASGLAGVVSPASAEINEVDVGSLALITTGADGSFSTTFTIPTSFSATDPEAACPPTQAQINAGLTCDIAIATLAGVGLNAGMVLYTGQGVPNRPTLHTAFTIKRAVKTLTESDVAGACPTPPTATSHCWWGAPVSGAPSSSFSVPGLEASVGGRLATNTLTVSPAVYCQSGATAAACAGIAPGTLVPPALSGTITTRRALQHVVVDEPNATPFTGNGTLPPLIPGTLNVQTQQTGPPVRTP